MEKRKVLEIPEDLMENGWKTNQVTIKRLTMRESLQMRDRASSLKLSDAGVSGTVSQELMGIGLVATAVVEAPWGVPEKVEEQRTKIADLDGLLGQWLMNECTDFNSLTLKKKQN